jgi:hypothetical protein
MIPTMRLLSSLRLGFVALACCVVFLSGCGGNRIEGNVTLDGQPVDGGTITFVGPNNQGKAGARIVGGKYTLDTPLAPGTYKVEIEWMKKTGKTIPNKSDVGTTIDETKQAIAAEYNRQSKLTADVKSGSNTFNFDLKSGGAIDSRDPGAPPPKTKAAGDN